MQQITLKNVTTEITLIPTWFITDYMFKAPYEYTKVYLYLFTLEKDFYTNLDIEEIANGTDVSYEYVAKALNYWHAHKVIHMVQKEEATFELELYLVNPAYMKEELVEVEEEDEEKKEQKIPNLQQPRPNYTEDQLVIYKEDNPVVRHLFDYYESYLGRFLTITDQKIIFSFYDWFELPVDLIEYLVEYCAFRDYKNIRHIEKTALDWMEKGLLDVVSAKKHVNLLSQYDQIMKALEMEDENSIEQYRELFDKWFKAFPLDIILEACNRTMYQASKPSLTYVSDILETWSEHHVKKLEDIIALDNEHRRKSYTL